MFSLKIFKAYSPSFIFRELIKNLLGYYSKFGSLVKGIYVTQAIIFFLILCIALSSGFLVFLGPQIENSLNAHENAKISWKALNLMHIFTNKVNKFIELQNVTQQILLQFAIYWFFTKILITSVIGIYCVYIAKFILSSHISSYTRIHPKIKLISFDVMFNPFPIWSFNQLNKLKNIPETRRNISLTEIINKFLDLQSFPPFGRSKKLLYVSNLTFSYHGDSEWDKWFHLFLKKWFPNRYEEHLIKKNTLRKEDEAEMKHPTTLKNINVSINKSTFTTILGCNGSSKTTFLKAIINLFEEYNGKITWITRDLKSISHKSFYKNVAYVAQENPIQNKITVYDYVACGLFPSFSFFKFNYSKNHPVIIDNLKKMGILHFRDKYLNNLSGGEKQKAILARVLTQQTSVIILDEPTTYLDIRNQYLILNLLKKLQKEENKTIIAILHDIKQAEQFSDEVILLDKGEVYCYGKTKDVITHENIKKVFDVDRY